MTTQEPDLVSGIPQRNNNARRVRSLAVKEGHHLELCCHGALQTVPPRLVEPLGVFPSDLAGRYVAEYWMEKAYKVPCQVYPRLVFPKDHEV